MKHILSKLFNDETLTQEDIDKVVRWTVQNIIPPSMIAAFIYAITKKGANTDELTWLTTAIRSYATNLELSGNIVDSCGTGADHSQSFNISTAASIVAAAAGAKVIKQTNSCITSRTGSSEFIHYLKLPLCTTKEEAQQQFNTHNIAFVHSPKFNKFAGIINPIRQELGMRSVFNFIGPMINPAFPNAQLIGVCDHQMIDKIVQVLKNIGVKRAMVVNGVNPVLDEISVCSDTHVFELNNDEIKEYYLKPSDFGIRYSEINALLGATPLYNANLVTDIFNGKIKDAKVDIIAFNAGAMLYLNGLCKNLSDGIVLSYSTINNGKAAEKLLNLQIKEFAAN